MATSKQSGQILLITLLVLTVASVIGISVVGRATTDTAISRQVEESSRAFSAAEAGIEQALKTGSGSTTVVLSPDLSVSVAVASVGGAIGLYEFPQQAKKGETLTLWLVDHNTSGAIVETPTYRNSWIEVCWSTGSTLPALIATVLYRESNNNTYRTLKLALDPDASRRASNNFAPPVAMNGGCGATTGTTYRHRINFNNINGSVNPNNDTLIMLRLRPVYADAKIAVNAQGRIPFQGRRIESTGTTQGGVNRKVVVYQEYRAPSTVFDAALYSQNSISH